MLGTVVYINPVRGMFAVQLDCGSYSVCEILDFCDLQVGDRVKGPLDSGGRETLYNIDQSEPFEVSVEWPEITEAQARKALAQFL